MNTHAHLDRETFHPEPAERRFDATNAEPGHSGAGFSAEAATLLEYVRRAMERNPKDAQAAAMRLATILSFPAAAASSGARGGLAPWQMRKVERYLREHLEGPLRVEEMAKQVPLSVSYFCRAFKESFGTTPHAHLMRLRLELAQQLMLTTREPLSQVALACGLADQAHLSKLFRRALGETPSAWRRRNLTDAQAEARTSHPIAGQFATTDGKLQQPRKSTPPAPAVSSPEEPVGRLLGKSRRLQ